MDSGDDIGACHVQNFVTALEALEVFHRGTSILQHCSHGAIGNDDPLSNLVKKVLGALGQGKLVCVIHRYRTPACSRTESTVSCWLNA